MSHTAKKADDRLISITRGITKWLPSNSHRAINTVSVVVYGVVGFPLRNICIFLLGLWKKKNRYVSPAPKLLKWSLSCFSFSIHTRVLHYHNKWQLFALIINTANAPIQFNSVSASHVLRGNLHTIKNSEDEQVWPLFLANSKFSVDRWGAQLHGRAFTQHIQNPGRGPPPRRWRGIMDIIAYIFDMYRNYLFTCVKQVCICDIKVFLFRIIPLCLIKSFFFFFSRSLPF